MPEGNELAQCPGVGNKTVERVSLRKLQYVRRRSCVRSANALVLERLCRPPQSGSFIESATGLPRARSWVAIYSTARFHKVALRPGPQFGEINVAFFLEELALQLAHRLSAAARIATRGRTSARSVCNSVAFAAGLQGWRVVNNNIETKVNTLATMKK
jgi:hypothetical protein